MTHEDFVRHLYRNPYAVYNTGESKYRFEYDNIWKIKESIGYNKKCVYILYVNNTPVYVGQSRNIYLRICTHRSRLIFDYVSIIVYHDVTQDGLNQNEMFWINSLNPPLNWAFVPFEKAHSGMEPMKYEDVLNWCNNYYYKEAV